jgi:hypothetical protein
MIWLHNFFSELVFSVRKARAQLVVSITVLLILVWFPLIVAAQTTTPACPVIGPVQNLSVCGQQPTNLTICVTSNTNTVIQLALFAQSVTDPYSQSALMIESLGETSVQSGTACIIPDLTKLPTNNTLAPIDYYMYACVKPDPDPACFASSFSVAKLTVLPKNCACPPLRCIPIVLHKAIKK